MIVILLQNIGGTWLSCATLQFTRSREISYAILTFLMFASCLVVDAGEAKGYETHAFFLGVLAVSSGGVMHWSLKLGYTPMFVTANMVKVSESFFRFCFNIHQGGAKLRGDATILILCIAVFVLSVLAGAAYTHAYPNGRTLWPVVLLWPLHLWLGGSLSVLWSWLCAKRTSDHAAFPEDTKVKHIASMASESSETPYVEMDFPEDQSRGKAPLFDVESNATSRSQSAQGFKGSAKEQQRSVSRSVSRSVEELGHSLVHSAVVEASDKLESAFDMRTTDTVYGET